VLALPTGIAELCDGARGIAQQAIPIVSVHPRARDDASAVARADFRLICVDQQVECGGIDIALLGQQSLERPNAALGLGEVAVLGVIVSVAAIVIVFHASMVILGRVRRYARRI
jgi:hypothetical protein